MFVLGSSSALRCFSGVKLSTGRLSLSLSLRLYCFPACFLIQRCPSRLSGSGSPLWGLWVSPAPALLTLRSAPFSATRGVDVGADDRTWISGGDDSYLPSWEERLGVGVLSTSQNCGVFFVANRSLRVSLGPQSQVLRKLHGVN